MNSVMSWDDVCAEQAAARASAFATEEIAKTHAKYAHLLPTSFPSPHMAPHTCGPEIGDGCCRCRFDFKRGGVYASWCGHDKVDSRKQVVRILGEIDNDSGGGDTWIVARILASDAPATCGQMTFFAPTSIVACHMNECEAPAAGTVTISASTDNEPPKETE